MKALARLLAAVLIVGLTSAAPARAEAGVGDPTICAVLIAVAPTVNGGFEVVGVTIVYINAEGDTYALDDPAFPDSPLAGKQWDCPPYDPGSSTATRAAAFL